MYPYLKSSSCVLCNQPGETIAASNCVSCNSPCATCFANPNHCLTCTTGMLRTDNTCITCNSNQFIDFAGACQACDASCLTCQGLATTCTSCRQGQNLDTVSDRCMVCGMHCEDCDVTGCRRCNSLYFLTDEGRCDSDCSRVGVY